jgi:hypothetical protein
MNNREFRNRLQAIAHGEKPREEKQPPIQEPPPERERLPQKEPPAKKPPAKSKQSTAKARASTSNAEGVVRLDLAPQTICAFAVGDRTMKNRSVTVAAL